MVNITETQQVAQRVTDALGDRSVNWLATEAAMPRTTLVRRLKDGDFTASELFKIASALNVSVTTFVIGDAA